MMKELELEIEKILGKDTLMAYKNGDALLFLKELEQLKLNDFLAFYEKLSFEIKTIGNTEYIKFSKALEDLNQDCEFFSKLELLAKNRSDKFKGFFENEFSSFLKEIYETNKEKFKKSIESDYINTPEYILVSALEEKFEIMSINIKAMLMEECSIEELRPLVNERNSHYLCGLVAGIN